jgi:hypothetical protein
MHGWRAAQEAEEEIEIAAGHSKSEKVEAETREGKDRRKTIRQQIKELSWSQHKAAGPKSKLDAACQCIFNES